MMKTIFTTMLLLLLTCVLVSQGSQDATQKVNDAKAGKLLSADKSERESALMELDGQYSTLRDQLQNALHEAVKNHLGDNRHMSPVHAGILAADNCRVYESEALLFSIVDYELSLQSLPLGIDVPGEFFFPAAGALARLRVDAKHVVRAMGKAENDRQLQLLTWILFQRSGSVGEAQRLLKAEGAEFNENLRKALQMLDKAPDILPPLSIE